MTNDFTQTIAESFWDIDADLSPADALQYINNPSNFRPFSEGLTMLICRCGYKGDANDIEAKTRFVREKLILISPEKPPAKSTVKDWFTDKRRPGLAANSRELMFKLCFALSAPLADVQWFFSHVYFDRVFNCHTKEEAVYYYCFSRQLPYSHAVKLLDTIKTFPIPENQADSSTVFTSEIRSRISRCAGDDELLCFFRDNLSVFAQWNTTALTRINQYISLIQGKPSDKAVIEACKAGKRPLASEIQGCGLVVQEYLSSVTDGRLGYISGKNITSVDFMLERIILTSSGLGKGTPVPEIVRCNFPNKKTFSDILTKAETSTSYDAIRKCLILLKFYHFWITLQLNPQVIGRPSNEYFDIYCDETNALLIECGHEELFIGNPYDWLFLWASTTETPLTTLRGVVSTMEDMD